MAVIASQGLINTAADLRAALAEACELEHGLACSYLYAAFSLKRELAEGLTLRQQQRVRKWASQIYFVASQEMLHLAQAWNLLAAVGGAPYVDRPNFPLSSRRYPLHIPLRLARFDAATLARFIRFERPENLFNSASVSFAAPDIQAQISAESEFDTIGRLYDLIENAITANPALIVGSRLAQGDTGLADFPDLIKVVDVASAIRAITLIRDQGEGMKIDRADCHFGTFRDILRELYEETAAAAPGTFAPARPAIDDPSYQDDPAFRPPSSHLVVDPTASVAGRLFDDIYAAMLSGLHYAFRQTTADRWTRERIAARCIALMSTAVLPLGELLSTLPSGVGTSTAGAAFSIGRRVDIPIGNAWSVFDGALDALHQTASAAAVRFPTLRPTFEHVSAALTAAPTVRS